MVDVVSKEAFHEQEHRYMSSGQHVGLLTLYNQYTTEASVSSVVHSDFVCRGQSLAYRRGW